MPPDINPPLKNIYLFAVDLEDVRFWMEDGLKHEERLPLMAEKYLAFLEEHNCKATFFVVGDVARAYPGLIRKIAESGHEVASHSNVHIQLDKQNPKIFKEEVIKSMNALHDAGVEKIYGFRAPNFSIIDKTSWAYEILEELNFVYSSSVFPTKSVLYGWPEFGRKVKLIDNKIWELPMTLFKSKLVSFPIAGGIYMRLLPFFFTRWSIKRCWKKGEPVLGYFHPYDIDTGQEHFMHPGVFNNKIYNELMYVNRGSLLKKAGKVIKMGGTITTYIDYVRETLLHEKDNVLE
ncbi:MAG TPA: polysaccharide deacetylase family protein [Bacteroidales bacterium]|nr:polysaccharide deacetylase family protein [Bacteroidales bacterium]